MSVAETRSQFLDSIIPNLVAEGYDVFVHPSPHMLPPFMQEYIPDAVALGSPKNLAIEIVVEDARSDRKARQHKELFKDAKDWEFRVYYFRPAAGSNAVDPASRDEIESSLARIERMRDQGLTSEALLMAWATLEAIGRSLLPGKFARPQTASRLIEVLASDGQLTPGEADVLRRFVNVRNRLAHGDLEIAVSSGELEEFVQILWFLFRLLPQH